MPALKTWLHPAVWFCIPLNVGQEAAVRSQQSPPALLATGTDRGGSTPAGDTQQGSGSRGVSPHGAPVLPPPPHAAPTPCRGRERDGCRGHYFFFNPFSFVATVSFTTIPQPSPNPRKPIKSQPKNHFPHNQHSRAPNTPTASTGQAFAIIFCISISVNPFCKIIWLGFKIPPSEKHLLNIGPDCWTNW